MQTQTRIQTPQQTVGARRPRLIVGYQSWRSLLFLHWRVRPEELRRRIPPQLRLDTFEGSAYVGLVAFQLPSVRLRGLPSLGLVAPGLELNVRTYVRTPHGPPGIFFLSLDATRGAYVMGARAFFRNTSHWARGSSYVRGDRIGYTFERRAFRSRAALDVEVSAEPSAAPAEPGTLEHFLIERYVVYAPLTRSLSRLRVQHAPYVLSRAHVRELRDSFLEVNGVAPGGPPVSAVVSPAVDCAIAAPERVDLPELMIHAEDPADDMIRDVGPEGERHVRRPAHWVP
jgi:uncharacterized protein